MSESRLVEFGTRYTAAWCSHDASSVATFYSDSGSLTINDGTPAVGRQAVAMAVENFMAAYPDLVVNLDCIEPRGDRVLYHWTFIGTNSAPGGTGNEVRISGYEDWKIGTDGLIADSKGHYDAQDWDGQVKTALIPATIERPLLGNFHGADDRRSWPQPGGYQGTRARRLRPYTAADQA